jgi:hypothetical protein
LIGSWADPLTLLGCLLAATVHDLEHTGGLVFSPLTVFRDLKSLKKPADLEHGAWA